MKKWMVMMLIGAFVSPMSSFAMNVNSTLPGQDIVEMWQLSGAEVGVQEHPETSRKMGAVECSGSEDPFSNARSLANSRSGRDYDSNANANALSTSTR